MALQLDVFMKLKPKLIDAKFWKQNRWLNLTTYLIGNLIVTIRIVNMYSVSSWIIIIIMLMIVNMLALVYRENAEVLSKLILVIKCNSPK